MKKDISKYFIVIALIVLTSCEKEDKNMDCSGLTISYASDIKPIISANCLSSGCHNAGSANADFTDYVGLKTVADNGRLQNRVVDNKSMPPSQPLSTDNLKKIKCWISSGAPNN